MQPPAADPPTSHVPVSWTQLLPHLNRILAANPSAQQRAALTNTLTALKQMIENGPSNDSSAIAALNSALAATLLPSLAAANSMGAASSLPSSSMGAMGSNPTGTASSLPSSSMGAARPMGSNPQSTLASRSASPEKSTSQSNGAGCGLGIDASIRQPPGSAMGARKNVVTDGSNNQLPTFAKVPSRENPSPTIMMTTSNPPSNESNQPAKVISPLSVQPSQSLKTVPPSHAVEPSRTLKIAPLSTQSSQLPLKTPQPPANKLPKIAQPAAALSTYLANDEKDNMLVISNSSCNKITELPVKPRRSSYSEKNTSTSSLGSSKSIENALSLLTGLASKPSTSPRLTKSLAISKQPESTAKEVADPPVPSKATGEQLPPPSANPQSELMERLRRKLEAIRSNAIEPASNESTATDESKATQELDKEQQRVALVETASLQKEQNNAPVNVQQEQNIAPAKARQEQNVDQQAAITEKQGPAVDAPDAPKEPCNVTESLPFAVDDGAVLSINTSRKCSTTSSLSARDRVRNAQSNSTEDEPYEPETPTLGMNLQGKVSDMSLVPRDSSGLKDQLDVLRRDTVAKEKELDELHRKIATHDNVASTLYQSVEDIQKKMTALNTLFSKTQMKLMENQRDRIQLARQAQDIAQALSKHNEEISFLEKEISKLDQGLNDRSSQSFANMEEGEIDHFNETKELSNAKSSSPRHQSKRSHRRSNRFHDRSPQRPTTTTFSSRTYQQQSTSTTSLPQMPISSLPTGNATMAMPMVPPPQYMYPMGFPFFFPPGFPGGPASGVPVPMMPPGSVWNSAAMPRPLDGSGNMGGWTMPSADGPKRSFDQGVGNSSSSTELPYKRYRI